MIYQPFLCKSPAWLELEGSYKDWMVLPALCAWDPISFPSQKGLGAAQVVLDNAGDPNLAKHWDVPLVLH